MDKKDVPEILAVVALPSPEERRRRQVMLARRLLVAVDMTLAGERLGWRRLRDLFREVRHVYLELVDEFV